MSIIYKWGKALPETHRVQVNPDSLVMHDQQWGEIDYKLEFTPRDPTTYDYELAVNQFVHEFELQCQEAEVKYVEASTGSNYLRMQIVHHGNSITLAAIAAVMLIVLKAVLGKIVALAVASAIVMAGYALYQRLKPPVYQCPICGETFESYETLVAHMQHNHPGAPIPDRPGIIPGIPDVGAILIIGGIVLAAAIAAPPIIRELRSPRK